MTGVGSDAQPANAIAHASSATRIT